MLLLFIIADHFVHPRDFRDGITSQYISVTYSIVSYLTRLYSLCAVVEYTCETILTT